MLHENSFIVVKEFTDNGKTTREIIAKGVTKQGFIDAYTEKGCVMRGGENPHFEDIYSGVVYKLENHFEQGGQVDRERDIQIAKTILMQLGGSNRLQIFTGAYNFVAVPNGVSFRIKNRSVNYVKIVLNAMDTYDIEFGRIRGTNYKIVKELSGIYNDQLVEVFNRYTGMVLRLRKGGAIQGEENAEMVMNQNLQIRHHTEELEEILKSGKEVPAWVVSKVSRAADSMSDATHYLEGTLDKMAMGGQVLKEYEIIPNTTYELKIQVYYDKGGMNYFSGGTNKRGYYLSVTPVQIERQGNNVMVESYTAFSGIKKLILEVERQSPKSAERAKELAESSIPELKQYVLNQMIERGEIPQDMPNPEPEPEPDFNIKQLKGEIEALKELLPFLEGDDKKEVEEQIEILNITLMQNDNFGGGVGRSTITDLADFDPETTLVFDGDANFNAFPEITHLGNLQEIKGDANFKNSQVKRIGNLQTIGGNADFIRSKVRNLGNLQTIGGNALFNFSQVQNLGNLQTIRGGADFSRSKIQSLGNLQTIEGWALFGNSKIQSLGNLQTIGGDAFFNESQVQDLGNLQTIGRNAYFAGRDDLKAEWKARQEADTQLESLKDKIRTISKKMEYNGEKGYGGYVVYLGGDKIQIDNHSNLSPYSAQASDSEVKVSFNAPNSTMVIFSNRVDERFEDNESFEKYGGLKYIFEPLTNKIASEILDKTFATDRYEKGGEVASIFRKAKNFGKRTLKKGVELGKSAKQKTEDAIHKKKKEIALDILWEVKENLAEGRDEKKALEKSFAVVSDRYKKGGGVGNFPPKGELKNKENLLLKYEKIGSDYEFFVYKPEKKDVSSYEQIKYVCVNKDCPTRMSYNQFLNYLYAETYLDDRKYAKGGGVGTHIDLFEDYENMPPKIAKIFDKYSEDFEDGNYKGLSMALKEMQQLGYTFEYYLDGQAYGLRPIGVPLNQLKGYEDFEEDYAKGGEVFVCPVGTQIQSLIFDKSMFNLRQAKAWAKKNNFENDFVDGKLNTLRIRQKDPAMFTEDGFRTIQLRQGVQAVIGCPKKRTIRRKK